MGSHKVGVLGILIRAKLEGRVPDRRFHLPASLASSGRGSLRIRGCYLLRRL